MQLLTFSDLFWPRQCLPFTLGWEGKEHLTVITGCRTLRMEEQLPLLASTDTTLVGQLLCSFSKINSSYGLFPTGPNTEGSCQSPAGWELKGRFPVQPH